ncbi:hypothetical protein [Psychromonas arctica]
MKKERKNVLFGEILQPQRLAKRTKMVGYNREAMTNCFSSV